MEPIFTESASETVTAELAAQLARARAALPPSHCLDPQERELTESREASVRPAAELGLYERFRHSQRVCENERRSSRPPVL